MAGDLLARIARRIAQRTGLRVAAVDTGRGVRLVGAVPSAVEAAVVEEIARRAARWRPVESALRVGRAAETEPPIDDEPERLTGALAARLLGSDALDELGTAPTTDDAQEGAWPYFAPTDPVVTPGVGAALRVVGGFGGTSIDSVGVARSASDVAPGDEALAEAVGRELREDAATTDLAISVTVRAGVVYLSGTVAGPEDAESAEAVAGCVPGVRDVVERLYVGPVSNRNGPARPPTAAAISKSDDSSII